MVEDDVNNHLRQAFPMANPTLTLSGTTDFSVSPLCSGSMTHMGKMMRSPNIANFTCTLVDDEGFTGWWSRVDRFVGVLTLYSTEVLIVNTSPWDGAVNGRHETIIRCTEPRNKQRVRDFLMGLTPCML
mmetsp:Transcript_24075/g.43380  ORF Transcript_24075/g.43380 Transcript_24075/m.43380 type:complete len:129 (-) Transcript_24075:140-526(-)